MISSRHQEFLRQKRNQKIFRIQIAIFSVLLLLGIATYVSHISRIRISKVKLLGGVLVTQEEVELKSLEYMHGSYLWLFPRNNSFIYPRRHLEQFLEQQFPRIETIDASLKNLKTLQVTITERKPVGQWCNDSRCYFLDSNSMIFAPAPEFSGNAYFKYYGLVATDTPIGLEYLDFKQFSDINNFINSARDMNLNPANLLAKDNGEFSLVLVNGGQIYFDKRAPISKTIENLSALLRTQNLKQFEYIDLRFGNKLYYKLK